jgi:DNA modification methylase
VTSAARKPSAVIDTRVIYCGDNLDQLRKLPEACVDLIYIDPPFNSNRIVGQPLPVAAIERQAGAPALQIWGETKEKRSFEDRHESTKAYIDYMLPLLRLL